MSSAFAHAALGFTLAKLIVPEVGSKDLYIYCALAAAAPDMDIIAFRFGIPYESMCGHRGVTHSLLFAPLAAWLVWRLKFYCTPPKLRSWLALSLAIASHGFLDAFTNGGLGVGFFIPFSAERYFFEWQVIEVSPINPLGFLPKPFRF